ncbi:Ribosomal RNA small subunit methyltransferase H [Bienertia sinuspersici]
MNIRKKENPIIPTPLQYPSMADQSMPKILQPCSKQIPTKYPLLSDIFIQKNLKKWPIKINFPGCRKPHQNWFNWVEKLALKYAKIWELTVSLAQGMKIALAPAVLACLYQNLTFITQNAADFDSAKTEVSVPAPFQIVQLWALERFPCLGSNLAKPLSLGYPRIARWDSVCFKANLVGVRRAIRSSSDSFCWRPYALNLENSRQKSFHIDSDKISSSDLSSDVDEEMKSFYVFLQPQELIGIDCTATYQPQRVMMQFGCDQEVPNHNKLSKVLTNDDENAIIEGFQQETSDEGDLKKPILTSETMKTLLNRDDEAVVSPESEVLNVSDDDNGTKQIICGRNEERSKEDMVVILDSDDEKVGCKDVSLSRSNTKRLKRRIGDSADYPLFINEYSRKVVKKSGVSSGNAIDVENY